jgi:hypothetical protein
MTLNELADGIEAAGGPDRELDARICVALKIGARGPLPDDLEYLSMPNPRDPGPGVHEGHYWFHCRSGMSLRSAPPFTASIDAALTLVPEGKGRLLMCPLLSREDEGDWYAHIRFGMEPIGSATAATAALALCAAALRARASMENSRDD